MNTNQNDRNREQQDPGSEERNRERQQDQQQGDTRQPGEKGDNAPRRQQD